MRAFLDIKADIQRATSISDVAALRTLAQEMSALGTVDGDIQAELAFGRVSILSGDYPTALKYFQHAKELCEKHADETGRARAIGSMGIVYWCIGDNQRALEHYNEAMAMHVRLNEQHELSIVIGNTGNVYVSTGDYPRALECYRRALAMHEELGDRAGVARITGAIGNCYMNTGDYPQGLELYRQAVRAYEDLGDRIGFAIYTCNLASLYDTTGDAVQALEQYKRSLAVYEELGDRVGIALITGNLGVMFGNSGDHDEAMAYYRRALEMYEQIGDQASIANVTGNVISGLLRLQQDDEASRLLEAQSTMAMENPAIKAKHLGNRATIVQRAGDLDAAHRLLQEALSLVVDAGMRFSIVQLHQRLRDLAQQRNDFAAYIEHNNEYQRITEEIRGKETTQKLAMMEAERRMESERREHEKERALLFGALPESVATRMLRGEKVTGDHYEQASVMFLDIAGFTQISDRVPPEHVVHLLEQIFSALDAVSKRHGVTKVKTIGDSYMAVSYDSPSDAATCAIAMMTALNDLHITIPPELGDASWAQSISEIRVRIGIHCGPVTAGVIGTERLQYDVWGDTVNVASRMESSGEPGRIHVSEAFATALQSVDGGQWTADAANDSMTNDSMTLLKRGVVEVKGKGPMTTYWLSGRGDSL